MTGSVEFIRSFEHLFFYNIKLKCRQNVFLGMLSVEEWGECGSCRGDDQCYVLKDCKRDIQSHLTTYYLSNDKLEEYELILARAGLFDLKDEQVENMYVCARHRENLSRGWKCSVLIYAA